MTTSFDFSKAIKNKGKEIANEPANLDSESAEQPEQANHLAVKLNFTPVKLGSAEPEKISAPAEISGMDLLGDLPSPMTYKEQLAEVPDLDALAEEFNNPEQPELFDDKALEAVHKACLSIESAIDNAEEVRTQLTFIMTELRKYPETAAKIWDSDIATMVKALRHNYNVVAFAKSANKKKKEAKASKVNEMLAVADASGLFDGLDL